MAATPGHESPNRRPLYTVAQTHRLTGVAPLSIRRWVEGYAYRYRGERRRSAPKVGPHARRIDDRLALSFLDLLEVRVAARLRDYGVGWRDIREVAKLAHQSWGADHPFALLRLRSDGMQLFVNAANRMNNRLVFRLGSEQLEFDSVVSPSLFEVVDFASNGEAERWWPRGRRIQIVVDPRRNFGQPVLADSGVPVEVLVAAMKAPMDAGEVARWFRIEPRDVGHAISFEQHSAA